VDHASLQPYLTAINSAHKDLVFEAPAEGRVITLARKKLGEIEAAERGVQPAHTALPSRVVKQILVMGLASCDLLVVRRCAAIVFLFAFFARADSGVISLRSDVKVSAQGLEFVENGNNLERMRPATLVLPWGSGGATAGELAVPSLMQRYLRLADAAWVARGQTRAMRELWRLSSDFCPTTALSSDIIGTWLWGTAVFGRLRGHASAGAGLGAPLHAVGGGDRCSGDRGSPIHNRAVGGLQVLQLCDVVC